MVEIVMNTNSKPSRLPETSGKTLEEVAGLFGDTVFNPLTGRCDCTPKTVCLPNFMSRLPKLWMKQGKTSMQII